MSAAFRQAAKYGIGRVWSFQPARCGSKDGVSHGVIGNGAAMGKGSDEPVTKKATLADPRSAWTPAFGTAARGRGALLPFPLPVVLCRAEQRRLRARTDASDRPWARPEPPTGKGARDGEQPRLRDGGLCAPPQPGAPPGLPPGRGFALCSPERGPVRGHGARLRACERAEG